MRKPLIAPVVTAVLIVLAAGPTLAADKARVRRAVEAAGLMGAWAEDCSKPPAPDNAWETFTVDMDGYVIDTDYEGTDGTPMYVTRASRKGPLVSFRVEVELGLPQLDMVYRLEGGRMRTWSSRDPEEGGYLIRNGRWVGPDTRETRWLTKCERGPFADEAPPT